MAAAAAAARVREELVGKRFLSVGHSPTNKLKLTKLREWEWRAGVVRASSHNDSRHPELTVLVEFDDAEWKKREWIRVYEENLFQLFLIEHTLNWSLRKDPHGSKSGSILWPALSFKLLVDKVGLSDSRIKPVEFLVDKNCDFVDYAELKSFEEGENVVSPAHTYTEVKKAIKRWLEYQDGQRILLTTPSVLVGERVEVYRVEGTTQWYTAVIGSYNENTRELALTDDTVLEEHNEDPSLVQICLIGDGVVESILRGENTGITPRRRTCTLNNQHWGHYTRTRSQSQSPSNNSTGSNSSSGHNARAFSSVSAKKSRTSGARPSDSSSTSVAVSPASSSIGDTERAERTAASRERKRKNSLCEVVSSSGDSTKSVDKSFGKKTKTGEKVDSEIDVELQDKSLCTKHDLDSIVQTGVSLNATVIKQKTLKTDGSAKSGELTEKQSLAITSGELETHIEKVKSVTTNSNSERSEISPDKSVSLQSTLTSTNEGKSHASEAGVAFVEGSDELTRERIEESITPAKTSDKEKAPFTSPSFDSKTDRLLGTCDTRSDSGISEKSVIFRSDCSRLSDERSASISSECSRLSDDPSNSRLSDDSSFQGKVQPQGEELGKTVKSSPASSPLVFDSTEPVRVWRDPKLVNSDNTVRHVHSIQHSLMAHPSSGVNHGTSSPLYAGGIPVSSSLGAKIAHQPVLNHQTHGALGVSHYPSHISPHVMATHGASSGSRLEPHALHISGAAPGSVPSQQNFSHLLPQHATHLLPQYSTNIPVDVLWQQKYSSIPATWMPGPYPDDLIDRRLERERRDQIERERIEHEKEKEREKEKGHLELLEREQLKRLKAEHLSQEQEQVAAARERQEIERMQREAVHQHFETSLRSASKNKSSIGWNPIPIVSSKGGSLPTEQHLAAVSMSGKTERDQEGPRLLEAKSSKESGRSPGIYSGIVSSEDKHCQDPDKWLHPQPLPAQKFSQQQQEGNYQYIPSNEALNRSASSRTKSESPALSSSSSSSSSAHVYNYNSKSGTPRTISPAYLPKVEPSFNLYGYQPFQHSYLIQDKLVDQVKPRTSPEISGCDSSKNMHGVSPHPAHTSITNSSARCPGLPSPPPLLSNREADKMISHSKPMIGSAQEAKSISPHSISPKHQKSHHQSQESASSIYGGSAASGPHYKSYDFVPGQPPRSPHTRGSTPHHHSLSPQTEPHNLQKLYASAQGSKTEAYALTTVSVITTTYSGHVYTNAATTCGTSHIATGPTTTSYGQNVIAGTVHSSGTSTHHLIQQGLVPNPIYSPSSTNITTGSGGSPIVSRSSPGVKGTQVSATHSSVSMAHGAYSKPGITSGTPIPRGVPSPGCLNLQNPHYHQTSPPAAHVNTSAGYQPLGPSGGSRALAKPNNSVHHTTSEQNLISSVRSGSIPVGLPGEALMQSHAHSPLQNTNRKASQPPSVPNHFPHIQQSGAHTMSSYSATPMAHSPSGVQMQPLNLQNPGRQQENAVSPSNLSKRKASKESNNRKRSKTEIPGQRPVSPSPVNPVLARVSAPSPLVASAATTITAVMNPIAFPSTGTTIPSSQVQSNSTIGAVSSSTTANTSITASSHSGKNNPKAQTGFIDSYMTFVNSTSSLKTDFPAYKHKTKQKCFTAGNEPPANSPDVSKTNSPSVAASAAGMLGTNSVVSEPDQSVSPSSSSGSGTNPVTKLKKAWLQRHSDEDGGKKEESSSTSSVTESSALAIVATSSSARACISPKTEDNTLQRPLVNGHKTEKEPLYDESTSSASEPESEHPNVKRATKSGKSRLPKEGKRHKKNSETSVDANTNDEKQEEHRSGNDEIEPPPAKQPKKRGRKPKAKPNQEESPKKFKPYAPGEKPSTAQLKRTGESFLQDVACCDVNGKLSKCRECRMTTNQRNKKMANIFCRFYAFRRLRYSKNGILGLAGFSEPTDATDDDLKLWLAQPTDPPIDLDLETSKFLLCNVGNQFCDLIEQEKEAQGLHLSEDKTIAWKRVVQGVREMCDVCETTLFNIHWACNKCGFVVCIDCYKARKNGIMKWAQTDDESPGKDRDKFWWLLCNNRQPHEQDKLMLTQIIADNALWDMGKLVHSVRKRWNITMHCVCVRKNMEKENKGFTSNGICKQLMSAVNNSFNERKTEPSINGISSSVAKSNDKGGSLNGTVSHIKSEQLDNYNSSSAASPLSWLADVALNASGKLDGESSSAETRSKAADIDETSKVVDESKEEHFSTLRELLVRPTTKTTNSGKSNRCTTQIRVPKKLHTLDDVINCMIEQSVNKQDDVPCNREEKKLIHYTRRYPQSRSGWEPLPVRIFTLAESRLLFPEVVHSWLCEGRLLRLHDPIDPANLRLFQEQWKRGQPVLVSSVNKALDMKLWHPESFARDFGDIKNDLVNCHNGNIVPNQPMRRFWEGFENFTKRMKDETGEYMLLKLKDWPPGDDFSEMLPGRFQDLMKALPMPEYTHRNGRLNLAGRLPDCFVRPDLGPKMYNAYGSALYPTKGTTNLHLDISDAVNVMVYVGVPKDGDDEKHIQEALRAIDDAGCDILTKKRVREKGERPGALWHIYNARDADKIRDLLNKVALERGEKLEAHHDPIHDQSWYLDSSLRERLYCEYGVEGYAIAQCLGDSVFIPAGAPHQVRNLHSCIKVAEDFVSPENVSHCFTLTQEFRDLSDTHTNHEDKLQVKNIIYHAVKDALSVMMANEPKDSEDVS